MRKVARDLLEYARGCRDFMPVRKAADPWLYPIDLEFTLRYEERYYTPKDAEGLPIRRYRSIGDQYNPTRIAAYALAHWNRLRGDGIEASREPFLQAAQWFEGNVEQGTWPYSFDWGDLRAPWISCMAQGEAISVLTRASLLTGDDRFAAIARSAIAPFRMDVHDGGVRSRLSDGSTFFEEYPLPKPAHTLNGYLYALIGMLDLERASPRPEIGALLADARGTLERNLHLWDCNGWSLYDLHNLKEGPRNFCTSAYHCLHATQLGYLGEALQSPIIVDWAGRWRRSGESLAQRLRAGAGKIRYRLRYGAQR